MQNSYLAHGSGFGMILQEYLELGVLLRQLMHNILSNLLLRTNIYSDSCLRVTDGVIIVVLCRGSDVNSSTRS
jgi:hypothetical protein